MSSTRNKLKKSGKGNYQVTILNRQKGINFGTFPLTRPQDNAGITVLNAATVL